jgi:transcriptional regulator with XRE-family HTH domain/Zn-dependent peptidase ImmA (M78 family)
MTERPSKALAGRLRSLRLEAGLSQADLARRLGISQAAISNWESGSRQPSLDDLYVLASELDVDVFDLLPRHAGPPVRAVLRGVAEKLGRASLARALEEFVDHAETMDRPTPTAWTRAALPQDATAELLEELGVSKPPIDVDVAAGACGVLVMEWDFDESLSGLVVDTAAGPVIGVNQAHPLTRRRFTIGHELGHVVLRHLDTFHVDLGNSPEDGDPPNYNWRHERAANEFSASLLMPQKLVSNALKKRPFIPGLARLFEVSELAMAFRVENLGLKT